jgi:predicted nuclease with TOPRIM domain
VEKMIQQPRTYEQLQESVKRYHACNIKLNFMNQKLHNKVAILEKQIQTLQASADKSKLDLADVNNRRELFICSNCKSDQTFLSEVGYVRNCLSCGNNERVNK